MSGLYRDGQTPAAGLRLVWTPHGPEISGVNPLRHPCDFCGATVGERCYRLARGRGKTQVPTHDVRTRAAQADGEVRRGTSPSHLSSAS